MCSCIFTRSGAMVIGFVLLASGAAAQGPANDWYTVVVPAAPDVTEAFAAQELQRYLERIFGSRPPLHDDAHAGKAMLLIGGPERNRQVKALGEIGFDSKALGTEGFVIKTKGPHLILAGGGSAGTLYAVYSFLEELGCRWYYPDPDDEIVPKRQPSELRELIARGIDLSEKPDFAYREKHMFWEYPGFYDELLRHVDWMAKKRMNVLMIDFEDVHSAKKWEKWRAVFPEIKRRGMKIGVEGHGCYSFFLPVSKYVEKHPEWFCEIEGQRLKREYQQFCTTNAEAVKTFIANLLEFLRAQPELDLLYPWPVDGAVWCECATCRKQSVADRYLALNNEIAEAVTKVRPDMRILHLAYANHVHVPENVKPHHHVDVCLCIPWGRNFAYPFDSTHTSNHTRNLQAKWIELARGTPSRVIKHVKFIRMYGLGYRLLPLRVLEEDLPYFKRIGVAGFDCEQGQGGWWTKALVAYAAARGIWNVNTDLDTLLDDYFKNYYGAAAEEAKRFYSGVEKALPDVRYFMGFNIVAQGWLITSFSYDPGHPYPDGLRAYVDNAVAKLEAASAILEAAKAKAADRSVSKRLRKLEISFKHAQAEMLCAQHLTHGIDYFQSAEKATSRKAHVAELQKAKEEFVEARRIEKQLSANRTTQNLRAGLLWSAGHRTRGPNLEKWLRLVDEKLNGAAGFVPMVWQIGIGGAGFGDYRKFGVTVEYKIPDDWRTRRDWSGFPRGHWPSGTSHAERINIHFTADAGRYLLSVLQRHPSGPGVPKKTVAILVDGQPAGSYTTSDNRYKDEIHSIGFGLERPGEHTITFDTPRGGGRYRFRWIRLELGKRGTL